MKLLLALLGVATTVGLAVPAYGDPGIGASVGTDQGVVESAAFLDSLKAAGITYTSPDQVIAAARAVCGLVDRGEPGLEVISDLKANNPGFTTDAAARFAAISANSFCPHQLVSSSK
ncbi:MAG TPA: DUF732 domain-containing protein [Mycobacterium sp.]|nr:DUF732 domain-containing protein [Mycobacterium sp.]